MAESGKNNERRRVVVTLTSGISLVVPSGKTVSVIVKLGTEFGLGVSVQKITAMGVKENRVITVTPGDIKILLAKTTVNGDTIKKALGSSEKKLNEVVLSDSISLYSSVTLEGENNKTAKLNFSVSKSGGFVRADKKVKKTNVKKAQKAPKKAKLSGMVKKISGQIFLLSARPETINKLAEENKKTATPIDSEVAKGKINKLVQEYVGRFTGTPDAATATLKKHVEKSFESLVEKHRKKLGLRERDNVINPTTAQNHLDSLTQLTTARASASKRNDTAVDSLQTESKAQNKRPTVSTNAVKEETSSYGSLYF
jgi:hypothetical protein